MNAEQAYENTSRLVHQIVRRHHRINGGEYDEWLGEAHVAWTQAYQTWDAQKAKFTTYMVHVIRCHLVNVAIINKTQKRNGPVYNILDGHTVRQRGFDYPQKETFDVDRLLGEVSADAWKAIRIVLRMTGRNRKTVYRKLREHRWTMRRIAKAFQEVQEALES